MSSPHRAFFFLTGAIRTKMLNQSLKDLGRVFYVDINYSSQCTLFTFNEHIQNTAYLSAQIRPSEDQ